MAITCLGLYKHSHACIERQKRFKKQTSITPTKCKEKSVHSPKVAASLRRIQSRSNELSKLYQNDPEGIFKLFSLDLDGQVRRLKKSKIDSTR